VLVPRPLLDLSAAAQKRRKIIAAAKKTDMNVSAWLRWRVLSLL